MVGFYMTYLGSEEKNQQPETEGTPYKSNINNILQFCSIQGIFLNKAERFHQEHGD